MPEMVCALRAMVEMQRGSEPRIGGGCAGSRHIMEGMERGAKVGGVDVECGRDPWLAALMGDRGLKKVCLDSGQEWAEIKEKALKKVPFHPKSPRGRRQTKRESIDI